MQDNEHDDLNIEIIDIDDKTPYEKHASYMSYSTHLVPKQRPFQAIITISIVILVLLSIIGSNPDVRNKLLAITTFPTSTPTQAIPAGTDGFYIDGEPAGGRLFVDGKLITHPPNFYRDDTPLRLLRGVHTLRWLAAPFLPQTCIISVPANFRTNTCGYNDMVSNNQGVSWQFKFSVSLTNLPNTQQKSLRTAIQAVLQTYTSTERVQPGEAYATDALGLQQAVAHEPLKVMVHYTLDTDASPNISCGPYFFVDGPHSCSNQGRDCHTLCNASEFFLAKQTKLHVWDVFATVRATFEYTTLDGKPITQTSEQADSAMLYEHLLPLQISLNGTQWHVVSSFSLLSNDMPTQFLSPICDTAQQKSANTSLLGRTLESSFVGMTWQPIAMPNAASCLNVVTIQQSLTSAEGQPYALCLYRFGIFLAANVLAHTYWPHMQVATQDEQHLAQQMYNASLNP